jgi:dipeptidyl aminopeptidase/acylaminoacyl peptidase
MTIRFLALGAALAGAVLASSVRAQTTQSVPTLEWALGEGRTVGSVPSTQWLRDGSLLMLDTRPPAASRTFEVLDPATGERRKAFDMAAAVASVNALKRSAPLQVLAWPQALDVTGRRALFIFDGDLFLLEFATSKFMRLTTTPIEEQSPEFSPDGSRLAFVRRNDLYLIDCATRVEMRLTRDGSDTTLNGTLSWLYWEEIFGRRDIGYWWSPDSKSIAYLQTDDSLVPISTFVDFQPEAPRVIRQHYPKAGAPNPVVRTGIVDLAGPRPTRWVRIIDKPFDTLLRVKWLPDGKQLSVQTQTRDQKEVRLYLVDRASGTATRVLTETGAGWINIHDDLHFLADGRHFLWASERDGNNHLYRYTLDGPRRRRHRRDRRIRVFHGHGTLIRHPRPLPRRARRRRYDANFGRAWITSRLDGAECALLSRHVLGCRLPAIDETPPAGWFDRAGACAAAHGDARALRHSVA